VPLLLRTGTSKEEIAKSPFVEQLLRKDYEVIYFTDVLDEYVMQVRARGEAACRCASTGACARAEVRVLGRERARLGVKLSKQTGCARKVAAVQGMRALLVSSTCRAHGNACTLLCVDACS